MKKLFFAYVIAVVYLSIMLSSQNFAGEQRLLPCPKSPNCVTSQTAEDSNHFIAPFRFNGSPESAWQILVTIIESAKRTTITKKTADYLHAEVKSRVFRFVDDVEFIMHAQDQVIHVRSASRTGYSDLGVNRRRIERLRKAFVATLSAGVL